MPRKIVPLLTQETYHVFNRGVDKRDIFLSKRDYLRFYLSLEVFNTLKPSINFEDAKNKERDPQDRLVQVVAYSLLPNHFHLILLQLKDGGISEFMKRVSGGYTSYFNDRNERSGALFQGSYKRIHIDTDEYYRYLFAYVNENHFVHKIVREEDVCYSSSCHYQGRVKSKILPDDRGSYSFQDNVDLARDIAKKREILKTEV